MLRSEFCSLSIPNITTSLQILEFSGQEKLSAVWRYNIRFLSLLSELKATEIIGQPVALNFPLTSLPLNKELSVLKIDDESSKSLYGLVTSFRQNVTLSGENTYELELSSPLALLENSYGSTIYQNQTIPEIVESVLRRHNFLGSDFRFELNAYYPRREYVTQWQESDLTFLLRILADVGIWFRSDFDRKRKKEILIFADDIQCYQNGETFHFVEQPQNSLSKMVWDLQIVRKSISQTTQVGEYNYRYASNSIQTSKLCQEPATYGERYLYGESKEYLAEPEGNISEQESQRDHPNQVLADIRQQRLMVEHLQVAGKSHSTTVTPGQLIQFGLSHMNELSQGVVIIEILSRWNQDKGFVSEFIGMPFTSKYPYRPATLMWPKVTGTLPAKIVSPDEDSYSHIDTLGRYRVKMHFDLNEQRKRGEESLWMRLAKVYAGADHGMHFPLIPGTEVAIAFTAGDPDKPYIAHALHNSEQRDPVTVQNRRQNIIRTPANNSLEMYDETDKEHIVLSTQFGKTQLNIGHIDDSKQQVRGEGFELRTDKSGAIKSAQGMLFSAQQSEESDLGKLWNTAALCAQLKETYHANEALLQQAVMTSVDSNIYVVQSELMRAIESADKPIVALYGEQGVVLSSAKSVQLSADEDLVVQSRNNGRMNILKRLTLAAGEKLSLYAYKLGLQLIAVTGKVEIQAQSDEMTLTADKNMFVTSTNGKVMINAKDELLLMCGGAGIRIKDGTIEQIAPHQIVQQTPHMSYSQNMQTVQSSLERGELVRRFRLHRTNNPEQVVTNCRFLVYYQDGTHQEGITDEKGESPLLLLHELDRIRIELFED